MDWLLANPKLLIAAIIICGYAIRLLLRKDAPADAQDREANARRARPTAMPVDPAEEERTRRIQEEIRRKIVERQQRGAPLPPPIPRRSVVVVEGNTAPSSMPDYDGEGPQALPPPLLNERRIAFPEATPILAETEDASETEALVARQRVMLEQLHALEAQRAAGLQIAAAARAPAASDVSAWAVRGQTSSTVGRDLRALLGDRSTIRRAILLREILGEPPGLQRGPLVLPRR